MRNCTSVLFTATITSSIYLSICLRLPPPLNSLRFLPFPFPFSPLSLSPPPFHFFLFPPFIRLLTFFSRIFYFWNFYLFLLRGKKSCFNLFLAMIIEGNKEKRVMNLDALKMLFKIIDHSSISVQPRIEAIKKIQVCYFSYFSYLCRNSPLI